jgi:hypothetical protein
MSRSTGQLLFQKVSTSTNRRGKRNEMRIRNYRKRLFETLEPRTVFAMGGLASANPLFIGDVNNFAQTANGLPLLHSNPNAGAVVYLDYVGGLMEDGARYAPFELDNIGSSTTSRPISTGAQTFTTQSGLGYVVGSVVRVAANAEPSGIWMDGTVTSYSGTSLTVNVSAVSGSGTYASWRIQNVSNVTYSTLEREEIFEMWRQSAMEYAMFNIDVTTERPPTSGAGAKPINWISMSYFPGGGLGGWYAFPATSPAAITFADNLIGAWVTHETGHTFGMNHIGEYDSLGFETVGYSFGTTPLYAPIMGGADLPGTDSARKMPKWVYAPLTTYGSAPFPSVMQSDLTSIANMLSGAGVSPWRTTEPDGFGDYGGTRATAQLMTNFDNKSWAVSGIINAMDDVDYFKFDVATAGYYSILVGREAPSAVDTKFQIENSTGSVIGAYDGVTTLANPLTNPYDQHVSTLLNPGTYYIKVESHGNYADIGQYMVRADFVNATIPWQVQDIGVNGVPGYAYRDTNDYRIAGSGREIDGNMDGLTLLYQRLQGDGSIVAEIRGVDGQSGLSQVGLTIRQSLDPGSKHISLAMTKDHGWAWEYRSSTNGSTSEATQTPGGGQAFAAKYLKITRTGNSFSLFVSTDGVNWGTAIKTQSITMTDTALNPVYIGYYSAGWGRDAIDPTSGGSLDLLSGQRLTYGTFRNNTIEAAGTGVRNPNPYANTNTFTPPTLGNITSAHVTSTSIALSWNNVSGQTESGYIVLRSKDSTVWEQAADLGATTFNFTDTGLNSNARYFYRVMAKKSDGTFSAVSNRESFLTRAAAVDISTIRFYALGGTIIDFDWNDVDGETLYRIYRSTSQNGTYTQVGTDLGPNATYVHDTGRSANTTYWYKIETIDALGSAAMSTPVSVKTRWTTASFHPENIVTTSVTDTAMSLDWSNFSSGGVNAAS